MPVNQIFTILLISELDRQSDAASSYYGEQKERVREMIEETLAEMLGGSLDNISVNQLYKSRQCK